MNGAQGEARDSGIAPNGENLDGVLGRFQQWTQTGRSRPPAKLGGRAKAGRGDDAAVGRLSGEAREVSYEQALRASRYRRPSLPDPIDPALPELSPTKAANSKSNGQERVLPEVQWDDGHAGGMTTLGKGAPLPRFAAASGTVATESPSTATPSPLPGTPPRSKTEERPAAAAVSPSSKSASPAEKKSPPVDASRKRANPTRRAEAPRTESGLGTTRSAGASPPEVKAPAKRHPVKAERETTKPKAKPHAARPTGARLMKSQPAEDSTPARREESSQPAFREMLESAALEVPAAATLKNGAVTALTLCITQEEKARLEADATKANLSVPDYLRECALGGKQTRIESRSSQANLCVAVYLRQGVLGPDELRDQVEMALSRLYGQQAQAAPAPPHGISALPGILGSFARRCIRRLRGRSSGLAVVPNSAGTGWPDSSRPVPFEK